MSTQSFVESQIADIDAKIRNLDSQKEVLFVMRRAAQSTLQQTTGSGISTGFRDAIRQALRSRPDGLTGKEIVQDLQSSGKLATYSGKVNPSVRVHNELMSLRKKKEVAKVGKRYRINDRPLVAMVGIPVKQ